MVAKAEEELRAQVQRLSQEVCDLEADARRFPTMAEHSNVVDDNEELRAMLTKLVGALTVYANIPNRKHWMTIGHVTVEASQLVECPLPKFKDLHD
jgi:hypothetical protein